MAAGQLNILVEQGTTFARTITIESAPGVPLNLASYTLAGKMKKSYTDATAAAVFTLTVTNAAGGVVAWSLTPTQTQALAPQIHRYDIELTATSSGAVTRILEGEAWVSASMTN